jgi:Heparinase II/III-like protein
MNRRNFLRGTIAMLGQQELFRSVGAWPMGGQAALEATSPQNLLGTTFTESFLNTHLATVDQWHPYPRWSERSAWDAVPSDIRTAFVERAEADQKEGWNVLLATEFLQFKRTGDRSHYDSDRSGRRAMLERLVLAECFEGKGRFTDEIVNGVWLICEESFWGAPAHLSMQKAGVGLPDITDPIIELFGAETAQLLSWTKYLVGDQLDQVSPLVNKRIVLEAQRRILEPARKRDDFWWMGFQKNPQNIARLNNWTPWINSNLLVTNLILEDDPVLRVAETVRITRSIDAYLNEYWPDAAEEEGPGYYSRSVLGLFDVLSTLESATSNSSDIFTKPFIDAMGRFILNVHIAGDDYLAYGDAHRHAVPPGDMLYRFGKAAHDAQLEAFGAFNAAKEGLDATGTALTRAVNGQSSLLRALPAVLEATEIRGARKEDVLVRDAWYPDFGLMTAREKYGSTDGMYVAVLASNNGRSHGHNDTGNFVIYLDGQPVTIDVGVVAYTAETLWFTGSPNRWTIWTMQSAYHNLPTVGGVMQQNGVQYQATDRKYSSNEDRATYSFNIALAYPKEAGIKSWVRTVTLNRKTDNITLEENFELMHTVPVSLSVITPRLPTVGPSGSITLRLASGQGKDCLLKYNGADIDPKVETINLEDRGLRMSWGPQIYRILLNSKEPVANGKWTYEFGHA